MMRGSRTGIKHLGSESVEHTRNPQKSAAAAVGAEKAEHGRNDDSPFSAFVVDSLPPRSLEDDHESERERERVSRLSCKKFITNTKGHVALLLQNLFALILLSFE